MSLSERVAKLYKSKTAGRLVAQEFLRQILAMSMGEAREALGFPRNSNPSDEEVQRAFRQRYVENRKLHPDHGGDPAVVVVLNLARDTLINPETHADEYRNRRPRSRPNEPPGGWQEKDRYRYRPNEDPVPPPPGGPFQAAVATNVDWKILSSHQTYSSNYVIEEGKTGPDGRPAGYWDIVETWALIGVASTEYVFLKLTKNTRKRDTRKTMVSAWTSERTSMPLKVDILKAGPKAIKSMKGNYPGRSKFMVLENKPSEALVEKARPTLSFKDAVIGAGLAESEKGRKAQVELEPVFDRDRWKTMDPDVRRRKSYRAYDWFVYVNGRKTKLDEEEVDRMDRNYIFLSVFGYSYDKKVNLTRLRGSRMKMGAKESIQKLADSLNPGPLKNQLEEISEAL